MCFFLPCAGEILSPLIAFDAIPESDPNSLSKSDKHMIFNFYKECIQRHIYAHTYIRQSSFLSSSLSLTQSSPTLPYNPIFISKNPAFTLRLKTLYEIFPDCKIICLLRDPVESIPSMVSYIGSVFHVFASPTVKYPDAKDLIGYCQLHYLYPLEILNEKLHPTSQWSFIKYNDLKHNLEDTILNLINRFELIEKNNKNNIIHQLKQKLQIEQKKTNLFHSSHVHSVELCCQMTVNELQDSLKVVYEVHQFEKSTKKKES